MHAATRKRRLVNRLIRKVNKLTAERNIGANELRS